MYSRKVDEIKNKTIKGSLQLITREIFLKIIVAAGQLLLVRQLAPSAFGIFAILSFIISTAEIFTDIGLSISIIQQKKEPTKKLLSTVFYIKTFLSFFVVILLNVFTPLIIGIYHQLSPNELLMLRVLSLTLLLKPLQTITYSLLERDLRYKNIAIIDIAGMIAYYLTAVTLAFLGFEIWSFIIAVISMTLIETFITLLYKPFFPLWYINMKDIRHSINMGKYFQFGFIISIIHNSVIPFIAGPRLSLTHIGFLDWSYNTASFPRVFIDNLGRVSFASFSRLQDDKKTISSSLEKAFEILSLTALFVIPLTLVFGHDAIHYFLNDRWLPALPALFWYIASIYFMNGNGLIGHAIMAIGRTKNLVYVVSVITFFEVVGSLLLLSKYGFSGVAFSFFITTVITFFAYIYLAEKYNILPKMKNILFSNFTIFAVNLICMIIIQNLIPKSIVFFIIKCIISAILFFAVYYLISPSVLKRTLFLLKNAF